MMIVQNKQAIRDVPADVRRVSVRTRGNFTPPAGWVEVPGAMHVGRGVWLIPLERAALPGEDAK